MFPHFFVLFFEIIQILGDFHIALVMNLNTQEVSELPCKSKAFNGIG